MGNWCHTGIDTLCICVTLLSMNAIQTREAGERMDAQNRTEIINVRLTPAEYKGVERIMAALNCNKSTAVRIAIQSVLLADPRPTPANPT